MKRPFPPPALVFFLLAMLTALVFPVSLFSSAEAPQKPPAAGKKGMVASGHPQASGIGGGGFMLIYLAKTGEVLTGDYRETAPSRATSAMYKDMRTGHRAVAVPGMVAGLDMALKQYGTMDLKSVIQPAAQLAEEEFKVSRGMSTHMASRAQLLTRNPAAARIFLKRGRPYRPGDRIYEKDLGRTYRLIAQEGAAVARLQVDNGALAVNPGCSNAFLDAHFMIDDVHQDLRQSGDDSGRAGHADGQEGAAVFQDQGRRHAADRPFSGLDRIGSTLAGAEIIHLVV